MLLTDRTIQRANSNKDLFLNDGQGLYIRVRASGSKIWLHRYKVETGGKTLTRWFEFGTYPSIKLAEARLENQKLRAQRRSGVDPVDAKAQTIAAQAAQKTLALSQLTVRQLFDKWFTADISKHKDGGAEVERFFARDVLPTLGDIPARAITKQHVLQIVDAILGRGVNRMARVALSHIRQMFRYAQDRELIDNDPTSTIRKTKLGSPDLERDRVLSESEISQLTKKIPSANLTEQAQLAIWILLGTCCRVGELLQARWIHVDLKSRQWTIPAENSKNGVMHTVYLSDFLLTNFKALHKISGHSLWCYPNRSDESHVSTKSLTKQIMDRQRSTAHQIKGRCALVEALSLDRGIWRSHDLRRTGATLMVRLGVSPDIVDRCLNHKNQNKMQRAYQHYSYETEKKHAWTLLGARLEVLVSGQKNVLTGTFGAQT